VYYFIRCRQCLNLVVQLVELGFHCGVTSGEFFNSDVLSLVVGEAEVAVGAYEGLFGLVEVADRLVDFVDRGLELLAREVVVAGEAGFEGVQFLFKVGDVDAL
jgi:hypothetical protein